MTLMGWADTDKSSWPVIHHTVVFTCACGGLDGPLNKSYVTDRNCFSVFLQQPSLGNLHSVNMWQSEHRVSTEWTPGRVNEHTGEQLNKVLTQVDHHWQIQPLDGAHSQLKELDLNGSPVCHPAHHILALNRLDHVTLQCFSTGSHEKHAEWLRLQVFWISLALGFCYSFLYLGWF